MEFDAPSPSLAKGTDHLAAPTVVGPEGVISTESGPQYEIFKNSEASCGPPPPRSLAEGADDQDEDAQVDRMLLTKSASPSMPTVEDPSPSIRDDLATIFSHSLEFQGSYYFSKPYPDAPNPFLHIEGMGRIGLPLSAREAQHIISNSVQAPFGKGERTLVDKTVRDTWEIDAAKIRLDNPRWAAFMNTLVVEVCQTLGVHYEKSQPRYELYKLLLYETGSHFLPHQDTEKTPGMFATIIVVLPSEFAGGSLHLSHGGLSTVIDLSADSALGTSVASWYTDVMHEVKPVTSGYRLALSYNLLHTTNELRPSLSSSVKGLQLLRHVLLSWQQTLATAAKKLIYLLDYKYAQASLKGSALKGKDAHIVAMLYALSPECQIGFGLASIECYVNGCADDDFGHHHRGKYRSYADDDDDVNPGMGEVIDRTMSITGLVDMDGRVLVKSVDAEEDAGETIPLDLRDTVESGAPDNEEYEGYQGNGAGQLEQWYRRTVLVLWPLKRAGDLFEHDPLEDRMLRVLNTVQGPTLSSQENEALDFVLNMPKTWGGPAWIARSICFAAAQSQDVGLWNRGFEEYEGWTSLDTFKGAVYATGIKRLGIDVVVPCLRRALDNAAGTSTRLAAIEEVVEKLEPLGQAAWLNWVPEVTDRILRTLAPLEEQDCPFVLRASAKRGGITFLRHSVIPALKTNSSPNQILNLVRELKLEEPQEGGIIASEGDIQARNDIISDILTWGITDVNFFNAVKGRVGETMIPDFAKAFLEECCSTGNEHLVENIVGKLLARTSDQAEMGARTRLVLVPLLFDINTIIQCRPKGSAPLPGIRLFWESVLPSFVQERARVSGTNVTRDINMLVTVIIYGGVDLLQTTIAPALERYRSIEYLYQPFLREIHARRAELASVDSPLARDVQAVIKQLLGHAIQISSKAQTAEMLDLCLNLDDLLACGQVLAKLASSPTEAIAAFAGVSAVLKKAKLPPTTPTFRSFYKLAIMQYVQAMTAPPSSDVSRLLDGFRKIACRCEECRKLVSFMDSEQGALHLRNAQDHASRVIRTVPQWDAVLTLSFSSAKIARGKSLDVSKRGPAVQASRYRNQRKGVVDAIKHICSDETVLRDILDADYAGICQRLKVPHFQGALPDTLALNKQVQPAQSAPQQHWELDHAYKVVEHTPPHPKTPRPRDVDTSGVGQPLAPLQTPKSKRRKLQKDVEVIDLTTP